MTGLISAGTTALGLVASQQQAAGELQAGASIQQVDTYNAQVQQVRASQALDQANAQASIDATAATRRLGAIQADYGAAGVQGNTGSALSVMMDQAQQGELARQLDLYRGRTAALSDTEQGNLDTAQGAIAKQAAATRAQGTLLTGITRSLQSPVVAQMAGSAGGLITSLLPGSSSAGSSSAGSVTGAVGGNAPIWSG